MVRLRLVRDAPSRGQRPRRHAKQSLLACSSCSARVLWFCGKQARVCSLSVRIPLAFRADKRVQGGRRWRAEEGAGRSFKVSMQGLVLRLLPARGVNSLAQVRHANSLLRFPLANLQLGSYAALRIQPPKPEATTPRETAPFGLCF